MNFKGIVRSPTNDQQLVAEFAPAQFGSTYHDGSLPKHQVQQFDYQRFDSDWLAERIVGNTYHLHTQGNISS